MDKSVNVYMSVAAGHGVDEVKVPCEEHKLKSCSDPHPRSRHTLRSGAPLLHKRAQSFRHDERADRLGMTSARLDQLERAHPANPRRAPRMSRLAPCFQRVWPPHFAPLGLVRGIYITTRPSPMESLSATFRQTAWCTDDWMNHVQGILKSPKSITGKHI